MNYGIQYCHGCYKTLDFCHCAKLRTAPKITDPSRVQILDEVATFISKQKLAKQFDEAGLSSLAEAIRSDRMK